uniref:mRNA-capping enzyme n=1 Tax=Angiostrongylus cantonensis TaxID=6313 RepID=A0A158P8V7_ANGCA
MSGPTLDKVLIGVPDRWMHCPKTGKVIDGLFFPFKTPLCALYDDQIEKRLRFHPEHVFNHPSIKGRKLGLWIDLTKTDRYYFVKEVESQGCIYRKIPLAGHGSSPTKEETDRFIRLVQGFTKDHPGEIVGVHCTHGFNRTGFLIAAYMVIDWAVDCAVLTFAKERPCGIYKQDYLVDLFERYGDPDDCLEVGISFSLSEQISLSLKFTQGKRFMDGLVQGAVLIKDSLKKKMLQGKIKELCGAKRDGFPGLQPVSLERSRDNDNLKLLAQRPYMVSWKADGMRYMIYICDENEVYAFDRDNEVSDITNTCSNFTFYAFQRFTTSSWLGSVPGCRAAGRIRKDREPMSVRVKDFWEMEALPKLFEPKFTKNVGHEIDGLILQPVDAPYTCGRSDIVLKWKPPSHNSIDFKVVKEGELPQHIGYLYVQNSNEPMATMKATKKLLPYDNKIIECTFEVRLNGQWIFMRERTDKSLPNSLKTAQAVYNSMINPIDKNTLIE